YSAVILSGGVRSRSRNAAAAVGEAGLSIPWRYLKACATGSLDPFDFAQGRLSLGMTLLLAYYPTTTASSAKVKLRAMARRPSTSSRSASAKPSRQARPGHPASAKHPPQATRIQPASVARSGSDSLRVSPHQKAG